MGIHSFTYDSVAAALLSSATFGPLTCEDLISVLPLEEEEEEEHHLVDVRIPAISVIKFGCKKNRNGHLKTPKKKKCRKKRKQTCGKWDLPLPLNCKTGFAKRRREKDISGTGLLCAFPLWYKREP